MLMFYLSLLDTEEEKSKFEQLYIRYKKLMTHCAEHILGSNDGSEEDAVHQAFLKLTRHLHKIEDVESDKTKRYLVIMAESAALDMYRDRHRREYQSFDYLDSNQAIGIEEDLNRVEELILQMPKIYQQVFFLKYTYGYSNKETAGFLEIKEGTVRQRLVRGKELLRCELEKEGVY